MTGGYLLIGDMHVIKSNLDESKRLIDWIDTLCAENNVQPIFMGDQYDTMAVVRVEVSEFWHHSFKRLHKHSPVAIIGNHDLNSDGTSSSMKVHENYVKLADANGFMLNSRTAIIGFIRDNNTFIKTVNNFVDKGADTILCHAEFNGAEFENGFYSPQGIDLRTCPNARFISGHIHKSQLLSDPEVFGTVEYIGTPRQLSRSQLGQEVGVWLWQGHEETLKFIPTPDDVSNKFVSLVLKDGDLVPELEAYPKLLIDVYGSKEYIRSVVAKIPEGIRTRTFPDSDHQPSTIKESEGIGAAFSAYLSQYSNSNNLTPAIATAIFKELQTKLTLTNL